MPARTTCPHHAVAAVDDVGHAVHHQQVGGIRARPAHSRPPRARADPAGYPWGGAGSGRWLCPGGTRQQGIAPTTPKVQSAPPRRVRRWFTVCLLGVAQGCVTQTQPTYFRPAAASGSRILYMSRPSTPAASSRLAPFVGFAGVRPPGFCHGLGHRPRRRRRPRSHRPAPSPTHRHDGDVDRTGRGLDGALGRDVGGSTPPISRRNLRRARLPDDHARAPRAMKLVASRSPK